MKLNVFRTVAQYALILGAQLEGTLPHLTIFYLFSNYFIGS